MIDSIVFQGKNEGPHILVFGAIHGNEKSGTLGIRRFIKEMEEGAHELTCGTITLVPVCNQAAYDANVRYVDINLNRIIDPSMKSDTVEGNLVPDLVAMIDTSDVLLDLHNSHKSGDAPFIFIDRDTPELHAFSNALPDMARVSGWAELYAGKGDLNCGDTVSYALMKGKQALLVECGGVDDPEGPERAYNSILRTLVHFGLIDGKIKSVRHSEHYVFDDVIVRPPNAVMTQDWKHFEKVPAGTVLTRLDDGAPHYVLQSEAVILLPSPDAKPGDEWLYTGRIL